MCVTGVDISNLATTYVLYVWHGMAWHGLLGWNTVAPLRIAMACRWSNALPGRRAYDCVNFAINMINIIPRVPTPPLLIVVGVIVGEVCHPLPTNNRVTFAFIDILHWG